MGVMRSLVERRSVAASSMWGTWPGDKVNGTWSGANVTNESSMQLLTVYGCVRLISDAIATLPIDVYRRDASGDQIEVSPPYWLTAPKAGLDRVAWLTQILTSLLIDGNAYIAVLYDAAGRIVSLDPLDPATVDVRLEDSRRVYYVNGQRATVQIVHVTGMMWPGALKGMSPVEAARQSIGIGMSTQEFAAKFFDQGATMSGVIEVPGELNPTLARDLAKQWSRFHGGAKKAHLPGVLQGGATWKTTGVTNEQAQFLETRKFTAAEIAGQMFLVDPSDLGIPGDKGSSITYANLEQRNTRRVQVTFLPWIIRIENALSALLAQPRYVKFNVNGLLRGDLKTRYETYALAETINASAFTRGEPPLMPTAQMRELEDFSPIANTANTAVDGANAV